jgi:hypothetical protein
LRNPLKSISDNKGKFSHFFNDMPCKCSTTYHIILMPKFIKKTCIYKIKIQS